MYKQVFLNFSFIITQESGSNILEDLFCLQCIVLNKLTLSQSQRSKNLCLITMNQRKYCYYISM